MFTWLDYVVFGATILLSLVIGIYYAASGGGQKTTSEYLMANRSFSVLPVSLSMSVSFLSSIAILGNSSETYFHGVTFLFYAVGQVVGITLAAFSAVPLFYSLQVTSINEYLIYRYDSRTILFLGWLWQVLMQVIYSGLVIYGPAVMFEAMVGFPSWASIMVIGIASTVYTTLGGLKAVIWTDVFQFIVIFLGLLIVIIRGTILTGGVHEVFNRYNDGYRLSVSLDPSPLARQGMWAVLIGGIISGFNSCSTSQSGVQRICALKSMRDAKYATLLSIAVRVTLEWFCAFSGIVTFAYFASRGCDPMKAGYIQNSNQVLPYFVLEIMNYWGIPGLFVGCVFSGSLSTVSSCLNGVAAITWNDVLAKRLQHLSEPRKAVVTKVITLFCGVCSLGFSLLTSTTKGTVMQVGLLLGSITLAPTAVIFIAGALIPRINWKSVLVGSLLSMSLAAWFSAGAMFYKTHQVSWPTTVLNCTGPDFVSVANASEWTTGNVPAYRYDDVTTVSSLSRDDSSRGFNSVYSLSHYLITPLIAAFSIFVSFLLSFIPGCHTAGRERKPGLYYPCVRFLVKQKINARDEYKMVKQ